jgi:hypothetical protein
VRVLEHCYLGNPFNVLKKIGNVLEERFELVRVTRNAIIIKCLALCLRRSRCMLSLKMISEWNVSDVDFQSTYQGSYFWGGAISKGGGYN